MDTKSKQSVVWLAVALGLFGVVFSYFAVYVFAALSPGTRVWSINLALTVSGPLSGCGSILARKHPQQKLAFIVGAIVFSLWVLLWILIFAAGAFRYM